MRFRKDIGLFLLFLIPGSLAWASVAPAASRDEIRKQLATFFSHIDDQSPPALTAISKSPETLAAINKRIASMSDAELADFQKMMKEVPDWQTAPQQITKMLPPEAMKTIEKTSAEFTKNAPRAERMRSDISTLSTVLKMLPDAKLKELGIDRSMIDSLNLANAQLSPLQAGILERQLEGSAGWQEKAAAAISSLPPALQRGAAALAKHGPITASDIVELEKYRAALQEVLRRVDALPGETKKHLKIDDLRADIAQLRSVTPDILFMVREQVSPEQLQKLSDSVKLMERLSISDEDLKTAERFRADLANVFAPDPAAAEIQKKIDSLTPGELLMMRSGISDVDAWKEKTSAYVAAFSDPGLAQRIAVVQQANPDPAAVAALEKFRAESLAYIDSVASSADPKLVQSARDAVQHAPLGKLEIFRTATTPAHHISPQTVLLIANDISLNCVVSLGSIDLGALGKFSLGSLDFNFICKPIQDAINGVGDAISSAVNAAKNALTDVINTVKNSLQAAIDAVTNTVNTLVQGIIDTANNISNFVRTIPDLAWNAIKSAFNALLDINLGGGLTLRKLIGGTVSQIVPTLQNVLKLTGDFWNSLNDSLPLIPCPPDGFSTPFGTVGTDGAVTKYNRYAFFLDKIFGLIPSDVFSLEVKIPAQVLYAAWQYLGLCLQDAANARSSAQQDARFNTLSTGITNLGNQASNNTLMLIATVNGDFTNLANQITSLSNLTSTDDANLTTLITNKMIDLTNLIKSKTDDARQLALRMAIEVDLQNGPPSGLVMFQLPQANGGNLELVRDTVNSDINAVLASGQSVGQAQKYFSDGLTAMTNGKFRDAFKSFQKAYSELTKP